MVEGLGSLYLLVAGDCNLACSYCYAQGGSYGRSSQTMTDETMRAALRKLLPHNGHVVVSFFGGEPMLNFDLIRETVAFGTKLGKELHTELSYALTTNGTLLEPEHLKFLQQHFSHVAVSIDGDRAITNHGRKFKESSGDVYGRVVENLAKLKEARIPYALRGTIPEDRAGEVEAAVSHMSSLGATALRVEPAFQQTPWRRDNWRLLMEGMNRLNRESHRSFLAGQPPVLAGELYKAATYRLRERRQLYPCMVGQGMLAVSTEGNVYPCHQFVTVDAACMGNVHEDDFPNDRFNRIAERLESNTVDDRPKCSRCTVRYVCGGECPVHCLLSCGDMAEPSPDHCALKVRLVRETNRFLDDVLADANGIAKIENFLSGRR